MPPIRVMIADDHELVRLALRTLLEGEDDIEVLAEAPDGESVLEQLPALEIDLLLLDLRMPGIGGVETCRRVRQAYAELPILVLTSFDDEDEMFGVLAAGASGYILKDTRPEQLAQAVRTVAEGQSVFDSGIAARVIAGKRSVPAEPDPVLLERLSERELEVLRLMAKGLSNKEIGRALWIGETTVKTHVSHILRKMGQSDRTQAVLAAVQAGLVRLPGEE